MAYIGAFLGGPDAQIPAGSCGVSLCVNSTDRQNLSTASWTITAEGYTKTVNADSSGRAYVEIPAGLKYTIELNHDGFYENDGPQTIETESKMRYGVYFDLFTYPPINTVLKVTTEPSETVTISNGEKFQSLTADLSGMVEFKGLPTDSTWTVSAGGQEKDVTISTLVTEIKVGVFPIYGVRIKISESDPEAACEYTDDAVGITPASGHNLNGWKGTALFEEIKPVVLISGPKKTYLNLTDLTKTIAGAASNIASIGNDAMTEFPVWYTYLNNDGEYVTIKYCKKQKAGFLAYAHTQAGQLQTHFYVGCFLGYSSSSMLYSTSGVTPTASVSITNFISYAKARGAGYDILTWFQCMYIVGLVLLAYKTRNLQEHLRGYVDGSAAQTNTATTFDNNYGIAGSTSGTTRMAFLWIWDLWGNLRQFLGRAKTNGSCKLMVIVDGYSSVTESDFEAVDTTISAHSSGYITQVEGGPKSGFFPKVFSGSSTTFWCDSGGVSASYFPRFGGNWSNADYAGPFCVYFSYSATDTDSYIGSRLSYCLGVA